MPAGGDDGQRALAPSGSRTVFEGRLIRVVVETWPGGEREIVRHPGAAAVLPITPDGEVLLVRQLRESVRARTLEIPAGVFDVDGERPEQTALRELMEETGYMPDADSVISLGSIVCSAGFTDERIHVFACRAEPAGEPEAGVELAVMPFDEAIGRAERGEIDDAKTVVALLSSKVRGLADRFGSAR